MNDGYAESNDSLHTYPNLEENKIAYDKSPNTSSSLGNNSTCYDQISQILWTSIIKYWLQK